MTALTLAAEVTSNFFLRHVMAEVREAVAVGATLSEALRPHMVVPRTLVKMVAVGERAGQLDEMLKHTADYYDQEVESFLSRLIAILEPALIIMIGVVVLVVAVALYLPIFHLSSAIR